MNECETGEIERFSRDEASSVQTTRPYASEDTESVILAIIE